MALVNLKRFEVANALDKLGLTVELLTIAVMEGENARNSCTKNDPNCLPGIIAWGRTARSLRDNLATKGWTRTDDKNFPLVVSPDGNTAIAVATGDGNTGIADRIPSTKYPKGIVTQSAVKLNQMSLFRDLPEYTEPENELLRVTWFLLKRRSGDTVFAELSLPSIITQDGSIVDWSERILLDPITFDVSEIQVQDDGDDAIEIDIVRRAQ